jgi:TamB, inner membrane protein subunit of TAM complex
MVRRPWIILVSLILLSIAFSGLVTFRYINRSNVLRDRILSELSGINGDFSIGRARLQPNNLILNRLSYRSPDSTMNVEIEQVSIRVSVSNLVQHSGHLISVVESVSLERPTISFRPDRRVPVPASTPDTANALLDLASLSSLERIILLDGSFTLETGDHDQWISVSRIEGWLNGTTDNRIELTMSASMSSDSLKLINIKGTGSLVDPSMKIRIDLDELNLEEIIMPEPSPVDSLSGDMDLHVDLLLDSTGWDATGHWNLSDGGAIIDDSGGLVLDRVNMRGLLENKIATTEGSARFEGDMAAVEGSLDLQSLVLTAAADLPVVHIGSHLGTFAHLEPKLQPKGTVETQGWITIDLKTREIDLIAVASGDELGTEVGPFRDIHMDYSWDNRLWELRFDSLATSWYGLDIIAAGKYRPAEEIDFLVLGDFEGYGEQWNLPDWTRPIISKRAEGKLAIRRLQDEGFVVSSDARIRDNDNPAFGEFHGRYSRFGYDANLDLYSLRSPDARVRLRQFMNDPAHLETLQPQLALAWWDDKYEIGSWISELDIQSQSKIEEDTISTIADIYDTGTEFGVKVSGISVIDPIGSVETVAGYQFMHQNDFVANGEFHASYFENILSLMKFEFMDVMTASGNYDFDKRLMRNFTARVEELDVEYFLPEISDIPMGLVGGTLNGRFNMNGPIYHPEINSHFELSDGRYQDINDYWGLFTLATDANGTVNIRQGALGRESSTLFTLIGGYSISDDSLGVYIESPSSDAGLLMFTLTGKADLLNGKARLRGLIDGPLFTPSWQADLDLTDGRMADILYDEVHLSVRGEQSERLGHVVYVDSARFSRPDHYQMSMRGAVPLDRGAGELDISLSGDILELLPQWSDFITSGTGQGNLNWSTTIVAGKPVAARGELSLNNGELVFTDILPPLGDLNVQITIDTEGLVNIHTASGILNGQYPFEISNLPGETDNSFRQPIRLGAPEIDLGVLKIRTVEDLGIPFRLPGINTTEQYSRLSVSGKQDEWLTIAGPADSLYIDGEISLLSATFTYPPLVDGGQAAILSRILPSQALFLGLDDTNLTTETPSFMNNARWDVNAYVGNDVRYERVIKGFENAPVLETVSGFLGQIILDVDLDPTDPIYPISVSGALADTSFRLNGTITSTTGRIEFLDLIFQMDRAEVVFDQTTIFPVVSSRAVALVEEEDFSRQMYLTLYVIDPVTGERQQRGRWGEFTFVLEDEVGSSQEEVLSAMGVGIADLQSLQNRFITSGAGGLDRAIARRWLGPVERDAANWLGLDIVQFRPRIATNLVGTNPADVFYNTAEDDQRTAANQSNRNLFRASKVTLGKYLDRDVYVSYTGQFGEEARYASVEDIQLGRLGLLQKWNLEYRIQPISPNFVIEFGWEYESVEDKNNRSARMKYSVVFDLLQLDKRYLLSSSLLQ